MNHRTVFSEKHDKYLPVDLCPTFAVSAFFCCHCCSTPVFLSRSKPYVLTLPCNSVHRILHFNTKLSRMGRGACPCRRVPRYSLLKAASARWKVSSRLRKYKSHFLFVFSVSTRPHEIKKNGGKMRSLPLCPWFLSFLSFLSCRCPCIIPKLPPPSHPELTSCQENISSRHVHQAGTQSFNSRRHSLTPGCWCPHLTHSCLSYL